MSYYDFEIVFSKMRYLLQQRIKEHSKEDEHLLPKFSQIVRKVSALRAESDALLQEMEEVIRSKGEKLKSETFGE